jgi:hypothetical protein
MCGTGFELVILFVACLFIAQHFSFQSNAFGMKANTPSASQTFL